MNWNATIREFADRGELLRDRLVTAALASDTVYMPSDEAVRVLGRGETTGIVRGTPYETDVLGLA